MEIYPTRVAVDSLLDTCLDYMKGGRKEIGLLNIGNNNWVVAVSNSVAESHIREDDKYKVKLGIEAGIRVILTLEKAEENGVWIYNIKYEEK